MLKNPKTGVRLAVLRPIPPAVIDECRPRNPHYEKPSDIST